MYLRYPQISVKDELDEIVSLYCTVGIDPNVTQWKNVTYKIEWYADGKKTNFTEKPFCAPENGKKENSKPCPNDIAIRSLLKGSSKHEFYKLGQWVRFL